jgi:hypothetical protein
MTWGSQSIAEIPPLGRHPLHLCEMHFAPALFPIRASKYALKISRRGTVVLVQVAQITEGNMVMTPQVPVPVKDESDPGSSFDAARPLAFMHIPKTSGVALMSALEGALNPGTVTNGFDLCLFGSFRDFETMDPAEQRKIHASPASFPPGSTLIAGHFSFSTLRQAFPRAQMTTILREPSSRLLSHWLFWRQLGDPALSPLGRWADYVRNSREPLARFLAEPAIACQTDNLALRMLLWPHPLIHGSRFIEPIHDEPLFMEAEARLRMFDFVDFLENENLSQKLEDWLGRALCYERVNETIAIPAEYRSPLNLEFTSHAHELLTARSRLDLRLWTSVVKQRLPDREITTLRERTILSNVARYGVLMAD